MTTTIPALTVWQPWATLIALGAKPYEFRGWHAPASIIGRRIGIHAGARPPKKSEIADLITRLRSDKAWSTALFPEKALKILERAHTSPGILPLSHMVATAVLGGPRAGRSVASEFGGDVNDSDRMDHCNWAWPMLDVQPFEPPIEAKGAQGFWRWTIPHDFTV